MNYRYEFKANPIRYMGEIGKVRFVKMVAEDAGISEDGVRSGMNRTMEVSDLELAYPHFHKVLKVNGNEILKILEPLT